MLAPAQPHHKDPQQEGMGWGRLGGSSPCPPGIPLGTSLIGLWRSWGAVTQAVPHRAPLSTSPHPSPGSTHTGTPIGSFMDPKTKSSYCGSSRVGHREDQIANKNIHITICHCPNSFEPHDDPEVGIIPTLQVRKMRHKDEAACPNTLQSVSDLGFELRFLTTTLGFHSKSQPVSPFTVSPSLHLGFLPGIETVFCFLLF